MTTRRASRIGAYLFAPALFAVAAMQTSFAQEPHPGIHQTKPGTPAAPNESAAERAGNMDDNSAKLPGRDVNPIDTRITVQSRPPRPPAPGASNFVARNAIGLPVAPHEAIPSSNGEPLGPSAAAAPSARPSGTGSVPNAKRIIGEAPGAASNSALAGLRAGGIDGTSLVCPALAPSGLGGPAKTAVGINGSTFRPRH